MPDFDSNFSAAQQKKLQQSTGNYSQSVKPANEKNHPYEPVHEAIDVALESKQGRLKLFEFKWRGTRHTVVEQCLATRAMRGITPVWLFSVATEDGSYKLRFDTDTLHWWLEEVYTQL